MAIDAVDCPSCGVVLSKITDRAAAPEMQVIGNASLVNLWETVLADYEDQSRHDAFVQTALQYKKLNFASQQYRKMLEVNPNDELAKAMQEKIIQIASLQMLSQKSNREFTKPPKWTSALIAATSMLLFAGLLTGNSGLRWGGVLGVTIAFAIRFSKTMTNKT